MKSRIACAALLGIALGAVAQTVVRIPDGTALHVRLKRELSSQTIHNGDVIEFTVAETLVIDSNVVVAEGATAKALIVGAQSAGHFSRAGRLAWVMQSVAATDGSQVPLRFVKEVPKGGVGAKKPSKKKVAAEAVALSPVALYYSPVLVAMVPFAAASKGKPESIPAGERYLVFVNGDAQVTPVSPSQQ